MRKTSIAELGNEPVFVTVATEHPRSEHMVPLADFLAGLQAPHTHPEPASAPPAIDVAAIASEVERRVLAALPPPAQAPPQSEPDLPAFMRKMAADATLPPQAVPSLSVEDAIYAINDIETRVMGVIEGLARRIDEIAAKLDMAPVDYEPNGHKAAVETLTNWLRAIEARANEAIALASRVTVPAAEPAPEPSAEPPKPAMPIRDAAIERVQAAAATRRNSELGGSADARDMRQRLVEAALNAVATREKDIAHMERLAGPLGVDWAALAKDVVAGHDRATALAVATAAIESRAMVEIGQADERDVEAIVVRSIEEINRVSI